MRNEELVTENTEKSTEDTEVFRPISINWAEAWRIPSVQPADRPRRKAPMGRKRPMIQAGAKAAPRRAALAVAWIGTWPQGWVGFLLRPL